MEHLDTWEGQSYDFIKTFAGKFGAEVAVVSFSFLF
jgi:hypothetical protein